MVVQGFPYENSRLNKIINALPFILLAALFISAIVAQFQPCEGAENTSIWQSIMPSLSAPRLIGS